MKALLTTALLFFAVATASAAPDSCPYPSTWEKNANRQLHHLLERPETRGYALDLTLQLNRIGCLDANDALATSLLDVYKSEQNDSYRLMTAVVLNELGQKRHIDRLGELALQENNRTVQHVTQAIVRAHRAADRK